MLNYKEYLINITNGLNSPAARENMPKTKVVPTQMLAYHFNEGFPILTGKKMPFYSILAELICFMQGHTDVRAFAAMGCDVWWDNAYKWNMVDNYDINEYTKPSMEEYKKGITVDGAKIGDRYYDLGRIYSAQWTNWTRDRSSKGLNQLEDIVYKLTNKPYERYATMTAWNPDEMTKEHTSQPNCHVYYQATCAENEYTIEQIVDHFKGFLTNVTIDDLIVKGITDKPLMFGHLTQRSCDAFLGVPFNITSYALLTIIL